MAHNLTKIPSIAQARFMARLWSSHPGSTTVGENYVDPTTAACIKYGWLEPRGEPEQLPNGSPCKRYFLSESAIDAIEAFFRERRMKRLSPPTREAESA